MGLFRKLECRALMLNGSRTSIALEPQFWIAADKLSKAQGISWQVWASNNLTKPHIIGNRASMLRVAILEASISCKRCSCSYQVTCYQLIDITKYFKCK